MDADYVMPVGKFRGSPLKDLPSWYLAKIADGGPFDGQLAEAQAAMRRYLGCREDQSAIEAKPRREEFWTPSPVNPLDWAYVSAWKLLEKAGERRDDLAAMRDAELVAKARAKVCV